MVIQQVDKRLLSELEAMGFSEAQARKALHQSGNLTIEAAVNWIVDNENDAATDETPMDPVNIDIEEVNPSLISEKNRSSKWKAEEKKKLERGREKERIREGKELSEARKMAEERERTCFLAQRKAEKEEERRAREKIRQKLDQDKAERRVGQGLPLEVATSTKSATSLLQGTRNSSTDDFAELPVKPVEKAELLRECLISMKRKNKEDNKVIRAFQTLLIYVRNVFTNPEEGKFKRIRIGNPAFQDRVGKFEDAIKFLELCGFERVEGGDFLFLPREKVDMGVLKSAGAQLQNALTNPFFGLLSR